MKFLTSLSVALALVTTMANADPITLNDGTHDIVLPQVPERIVALEFSFVDALASVKVSPVGVADDNDATRLPKEIRDITGS